MIDRRSETGMNGREIGPACASIRTTEDLILIFNCIYPIKSDSMCLFGQFASAVGGQ